MLFVEDHFSIPYVIHTRYLFWVTGKGKFPFDMLRFDQCWPVERADDMGEVRYRSIRLMSLSGEPTIYRWHAHGWAVTKEAPLPE
jgi:hypothetical protein